MELTGPVFAQRCCLHPSRVDLQIIAFTDAEEIDHKIPASYQPGWDEAAEVIGISVSLLDVTNHRRHEEEISHDATPREFAAEVNPEAPWVMDGDLPKGLPRFPPVIG